MWIIVILKTGDVLETRKCNSVPFVNVLVSRTNHVFHVLLITIHLLVLNLI